MKTSSAKAKGRRCASLARETLLRHASVLEPGDINVTSSGVTGPDLILSPLAKRIFPFAIECKNVEKLNVWEALKQAESHVHDNGLGSVPVLIFSRNHSRTYIAMELEAFLKLYFRTGAIIEGKDSGQ